MKRIFFALVLFSLSVPVRAQRFSVGTNAVDWASLGTINLDGSVAVSQHASVHAGAEVNPWTFRAGDQATQFQLRHASYWAEGRWWPWYVYSGWWFGGDLRYSVYNLGGVLSRETQEGDAYGIGAYAGYSLMLTPFMNIDFGVGVWGGYTQYTRYACPLCGVRIDHGGKGFILPDARVAIQFIF